MQWSVRNCGRSRIRQMRSMSGTIFERIAKRRFEFVLHMIEHWRPPSDRLRRYPRLLLLCGPIGPVAHAGDGDVRLHPLGLPMEHWPHLEIVLGV